MMAFFPALALNGHTFEVFGPDALVAKVKTENGAALRFNEQLGYRSRGSEVVETAEGPVPLQVMELRRADHLEAAARFSKFVRS